MADEHKIHDGKKPEDKTSVTHVNHVHNTNNKPEEKVTKQEEKKSDKKPTTEHHEKKKDAIVNGKDLSVGLKHAIAVSNYIKGKDIDQAIEMLEQVVKMKKAVPMRGEIPHKHGMMSGRYPVKAAGIYIKLLKSLKSNAIHNELELEKFKIHAVPNNAPRPYKRFGNGRFKRSHVTIKLIPITKQEKHKK